MPLYFADGVIQSAFTEISSNVSTTSTTYVNLMSLSINTSGNTWVIVQFSVSCADSAATQWTEFQLLLDGVTTSRGIAVFSTSSGNGNSGALVYRTGQLAAGSHTFAIQWHIGTFAGGSGTISPTTVTTDHAILVLEEVSV